MKLEVSIQLIAPASGALGGHLSWQLPTTKVVSIQLIAPASGAVYHDRDIV